MILQSNLSQYEGEDIAVFKNRDNWHSWQKDLFNYIFDENEDFRPPSHREILFIFDRFGNTGKSSFIKWLRVTYEQEIGIITEANAQQLRSALITIGKKSLYIVDLPRTKSKQGVNDVLNVLEQVKSGMIQTVMYGRPKEMIFEPVHIIVFGNYVPVGCLSTDRFKTWRLERKNGSENVIKEDISKESQFDAKKEIKTNQLAEELNTLKKDERLSKLMDKYQDFEQMSSEEIDKFLKKLEKNQNKKRKGGKRQFIANLSQGLVNSVIFLFKLPLKTAKYTITISIASGIIYFIAIPIAKKYITPDSIFTLKLKMKDLLTILKLKLLFGDVPPSIRDDSFDIVDIGSVLPEEIQQRIPKIILEKKINNQALAIILEFYSKNRKPINNGLITTVELY